MTTEEAIRHIRDILAENNSIKPSMVVFELEKEALYMAIKALEHEAILDKIRAEIEDLTYYCWEVNPRTVIDDVLKIINKYKSESEG